MKRMTRWIVIGSLLALPAVALAATKLEASGFCPLCHGFCPWGK